MDNAFVFVMVIVAVIMGFVIGNDYGRREDKISITECEKELPRNVHCKIIAVPVDKN